MAAIIITSKKAAARLPGLPSK